MKRRGILNGALSQALAELGHTDRIVVGDCGLPRPPDVRVVDLALTFGIPTFADVVNALAEEIVVESYLVANETRERNHAVMDLLRRHFEHPRSCSHEELKGQSTGARLFIRSGESTPYANVILTCGVPF